MTYYAGLDISMEETFICILDKENAPELKAQNNNKQILCRVTYLYGI